MVRIDFLISNNRHHVSMMVPIVKELAERPNYMCRVLSLCEFRGMESPAEQFDFPGVHFKRLVPFNFRSPSTGQRNSNEIEQPVSSIFRNLSWQLFLFWRFFSNWFKKPDLVVMPNDGAFPYDKIAKYLRERHIQFLLVQEGIKFRYTNYGTGGATALALWGEGSIDFFRHQGVPDECIYLTGNPRFDVIGNRDWRKDVEEIQASWYYGKKILLFLSNPIDDLGYCSTDEKMKLVSRFVEGISPLFKDLNFHLIIKLHSRESLGDFQSLVITFPFSKQIAVMSNEPLYPLLSFADAAVMFASSAGLEALLFDVPLGILEIPGVGFLHDFVEKGAAKGISWKESISEQVNNLLSEEGNPNQKVLDYINQVVAVRKNSTSKIIELIDNMVHESA